MLWALFVPAAAKVGQFILDNAACDKRHGRGKEWVSNGRHPWHMGSR